MGAASTLLGEMRAAAGHLKIAMELAGDWRVREAVASAATVVECGVHIQQKIEAGELGVERRPPDDRKPENLTAENAEKQGL